MLKKIDWHDGGGKRGEGRDGEGSPTTLDWLNIKNKNNARKYLWKYSKPFIES